MLRWMFFSTWVGILVALLAGLWMMIRISVKLDRDAADREVMRHLLTSAMRTAIQMAPDIHTTSQTETSTRTTSETTQIPPGTMGLDFGASMIWSRFRSLVGVRSAERRSGQERRARA